MRLIEKIKCILEMGFLILVMILIWIIAGKFIYSIFDGILYMLPSFLSRVIYNIGSIIYNIFGLIIGTIIFIHIFKVRYLDYFVTIEDDNTKHKKIEKPVDEIIEEVKEDKRQFIEHKKNKIIIRDPKHSTYSFFGVLAHIVIWAIKFILLFVEFFGIICFIILVFGLTFSIWKIFNGVFFLGISIVILACILINFIILKIIYNFILNLKHNFKRLFYLFIIGFILVGVGSGISFCTYMTFEKMDVEEEIEYTTYEEVLDINKENIVIDFLYDNRTDIVIDNSRSDIKVEIIYNKNGYVYLDYYEQQIYKYNYINYNVYYANYYDGYDNFIDAMIYLVEKLENKERFDDYQYVGISKYKVTLSQASLDKLKTNQLSVLYN